MQNSDLIKQAKKAALLQQIRIKPATQIKTNRFVHSTASAAPCNGQCASGSCR